jgi:hypothetical protein
LKTAVLISGHVRSYAKVFENQGHMLYDRLGDVVFFASVVDDGDCQAIELLRGKYGPERVRIERIFQPEHIADPANLEHILLASPHEIAKTSTVQGVLKQFWHLVRVAEFAGGCPNLGRFDRIVRLRPDLKFHSAPDNWPEPNRNEVICPWWARAGGINDRFAIMGPSAACAYFYTLIWARNRGWPQGNPIHPESMLAASLRAAGVTINPTLMSTFSCVRNSGEYILPDTSIEDLADLMVRLQGQRESAVFPKQ